jgi:hypothetical protein
MVVNPDYDEKVCPGGTIANYGGMRKQDGKKPGYALGSLPLTKNGITLL